MSTDITERGLEAIIARSLCTEGGYTLGDGRTYDRQLAFDPVELLAFLEATQPDVVRRLGLDRPGPGRDDFAARVRAEVARRGVVEVLREGVKHLSETVRMYAPRPTEGNAEAAARFAANRFTVVRQLFYSVDERQRALDLALFVNGLPLATFELKNTLTHQGWQDAIQQYKKTRLPQELLFQFKRCLVHFALDDQQVWMCTRLAGDKSWFLPFNKGDGAGGAGNPPNPDGVATDYLWREVLRRDSLCDILENYAQRVKSERDDAGRREEKLVFPRYHQLTAVRALLAHARAHGIGHKYLVQHSAGSGKSNSIAWLVHQLVSVEHAGQTLFDSVVVVTDRRVLDKQLRDNISAFARYGNIVGVAQRAGELAAFLHSGKKIITTTLQKFPFVLDEIADNLVGKRFAIVIDEAHSSQGGSTMEKMNEVLGAPRGLDDEGDDDADDYEDQLVQCIARRKLLKNASYFAFTATPKNKTLEMFGVPVPPAPGADKGTFEPFHLYSMRQAIEEEFIKDVLRKYVPVHAAYTLVKKVEGDPSFDAKRSQKKLWAYVESQQDAIASKAEIMVDHFLEEVIQVRKLGGEARAMVVASSIRRAIAYKVALDRYLGQITSPYKAIVAFSGEHELTAEELGGTGQEKQKVDEAKLNGFPSGDIPKNLRQDPYRFLIVADKFQTGFDEPLLYAMYVDKTLSGTKAVQTLSRLNRACPGKDDPMVLDFADNEAAVVEAFQKYYTRTVLLGATDPNKLHDLKSDLDGWGVYPAYQVTTVVKLFLEGASREKLDPTLDACRAVYLRLDEEGQVDFKSKAKAFVRTYNFLGTVLAFGVVAWEELAIFLRLLVPKLPAPKSEDATQGILEAVDLERYRIEVKAQRALSLVAEEGVLDPVPTGAGASLADLELERLSEILRTFNELCQQAGVKDPERAARLLAVDIPRKVADDPAVRNALRYGDLQNARIESNRATEESLTDAVTDFADLYKLFLEMPSFRRAVTDAAFDTARATARQSDDAG